jgi:3-deoxy-D-manno-octulosonic-acid transferase
MGAATTSNAVDDRVTTMPALYRSERLHEQAARLVYTVAGICLLPFLVGHLLWRGIRQPDYLRHWSERFFGLSMWRPGNRSDVSTAFPQRHDQQVLWIHAVSVGETRAAVPLIEHWLSANDARRVVLTHTTPTGRDTGQALFAKWQVMDPPRLVQRYLPYDLPWANALFFAWAKPTLGVLMETELWPNLLAQASRRHLPVVLINARLSPRSAKRLQQFSWLSRPAIQGLAGIAAQTQSDADGFLQTLATHQSTIQPAAAVPIQVVGNMKFDVSVPKEMRALGAQWRNAMAATHVWLAASTREDEEIPILNAWEEGLASGTLTDSSVLVIVPRHPQRFDRVAKLIASSGLSVQRRSQWDPHRQCAVVLGDSLGEMFAYVQMADVVLMGGSLPDLGGQNPIEACAVGRPVFFGPNMFNFAQIARALDACGAGKKIYSAREWIESGSALLADSSRYAASANAAIAFAKEHSGATERTAVFLDAILQAGR